jgi:endo-1,4-beta-xylanase
MKNKLIISLILLGMCMFSCTKPEDIGILNKGNFTDVSSTLKASAGFPIGFAIENTPFLGDADYKNVVAQEGSSVTFGNLMKHYSIVKSNGDLDFTNTDALYDAATAAGLEVFGHTLLWHSNQNAGYVKTFAGVTIPAPTQLATNPTFDASLSGWSTFNAQNGATVTHTTATGEFRTGTGAMKVVNPVANAGGEWRVQVSSTAFATTSGKKYIISYWVKAASAGGSIRMSTGPSAAQYQGGQTIGTAWQQVSWTITASLTSTTFLFDMGLLNNTYFIDDVSVTEEVVVPSGAEVNAKVDQALNSFVTGIVTKYKGKVKAWDVVNELFTENGSIRNNSNTTVTASDVFVWSHYLGKDAGLKAFQYAAAADPDALLFINDYNLEAPNGQGELPKLDSLIAYIDYLKSKGAKVDGIGTQMHISINTSKGGIEKMFQKLGATGLKIRISELDIRANPTDKLNYTDIDEYALIYQAAMYEFVVKSYLKNVPPAQRHGITFWGVSDKDSWITVWQKKIDAPLLFDANYGRKPAFSAVLQTLKAGQ